MNRYEIRFFEGGVYLVHMVCGLAYQINEGISLSTLTDWTIAHTCPDSAR
jgi:hypothetical protein